MDYLVEGNEILEFVFDNYCIENACCSHNCVGHSCWGYDSRPNFVMR